MNQENHLSAQNPETKKSRHSEFISESRHSELSHHSELADRHSEFDSESVNKIHKFCKICGAPLDEGDLFCIQCGWKIDFSDEEKNEQKTEIKISSDWLNAAKRQQQNGLEEELKNRRNELEKFKPKDEKPENRMSLSGLTRQSSSHNFQNQTSGAKYFVHNDEEKSEYLIIKTVSGSRVSGEIKTLFRNSSFANERFEGTLEGNSLSFHVVQKDLHPAPGYRIVADISFSGIADDDKIAGTITRENGSLFITYTKC